MSDGSAPAGAPTLTELERFLHAVLGVAEGIGDEPAGILRPRGAPVARLGLALDAAPGFRAWVEAERLDAVLLHRPWRLPPDGLPAEVGLLAYHAPFDRHFGLGYNPRLAAVLGMDALRPLGERGREPVGMCGAVDAQTFAALVERVTAVFGGVEAVVPPSADGVGGVAVMGAMTAALVSEAADEGVDAYLTGQIRVPAREAVARTGIGVVAIGHHRSEQWGLGALGETLRREWPELSTTVRSLG